jgi:5'-nucleotidase
MNILISNDDGVYAKGLEVLVKGLKDLATIYVVAPLEERSTTGHSLSLTNPLRIVEIEENVYGCSGYPADCTLVGIGHILKEKNLKPDLVISGINDGANLGQDIYYSGTVAAAREAAFHNIPGIAISLTSGMNTNETKCFSTILEPLHKWIKNDIHKKIGDMTIINVNVPNVEYKEIKGIELCHLGFRSYSEDIDQRLDFRNKPYYWIVGHNTDNSREAGSDCNAIANNKISFTPLNLLYKNVDGLSNWKKFLN